MQTREPAYKRRGIRWPLCVGLGIFGGFGFEWALCYAPPWLLLLVVWASMALATVVVFFPKRLGDQDYE